MDAVRLAVRPDAHRCPVRQALHVQSLAPWSIRHSRRPGTLCTWKPTAWTSAADSNLTTCPDGGVAGMVSQGHHQAPTFTTTNDTPNAGGPLATSTQALFRSQTCQDASRQRIMQLRPRSQYTVPRRWVGAKILAIVGVDELEVAHPWHQQVHEHGVDQRSTVLFEARCGTTGGGSGCTTTTIRPTQVGTAPGQAYLWPCP